MGRHWLKKALAAAVGGALLAPGVLLGSADVPEAPPVAVPETTSAPAPQQPAQEGAADPAPAPAPDASPAAAEEQPTTPPPARPRARPRDAEPAEAVVRAAASSGVAIENFLYAPATVEVAVGDTVTWTNRDQEPHTATGNGGSFDTGTLNRGESGSHRFTAAGRFPYICALHPNMRGTVVVAGSGQAAPPSKEGSGGGSAPSTPRGAAGSDAPTLPATGAGVLIVALLGSALTGLGAELRRRLSNRAA